MGQPAISYADLHKDKVLDEQLEQFWLSMLEMPVASTGSGKSAEAKESLEDLDLDMNVEKFWKELLDQVPCGDDDLVEEPMAEVEEVELFWKELLDQVPCGDDDLVEEPMTGVESVEVASVV